MSPRPHLLPLFLGLLGGLVAPLQADPLLSAAVQSSVQQNLRLVSNYGPQPQAPFNFNRNLAVYTRQGETNLQVPGQQPFPIPQGRVGALPVGGGSPQPRLLPTIPTRFTNDAERGPETLRPDTSERFGEGPPSSGSPAGTGGPAPRDRRSDGGDDDGSDGGGSTPPGGQPDTPPPTGPQGRVATLFRSSLPRVRFDFGNLGGGVANPASFSEVVTQEQTGGQQNQGGAVSQSGYNGG